MSSWRWKIIKPLLFVGLGSSLAIALYYLPIWQPSPSIENATPQTLPPSEREKTAKSLLAKGFLELEKYCQTTPSPQLSSQSSSIAEIPEAETLSSLTRESPDYEPEVVKPRCPNWLVQPVSLPEPQQSPKPSLSSEFIAFFDQKTTSNVELTLPPLPPASPLGQLNRQARLAQVPIFMYHDILPRKEVFFDVTPEELESHFERLKEIGATPISPDWLLAHLRTGYPLPEKPVLLSFDDGYGGHYDHVYPLLKKYNYPAIFSVYVNKMKGTTARSSLTWAQLREMANNPLVTIASHTISHPRDLRDLSDDELAQEVLQAKTILEERLGKEIHYFTYPEGHVDARVKQWVIAAGYQMAFSMNDSDEKYAGESPDLLTLGRFGQSRLREIAPRAWGGYPAPVSMDRFNFKTPIEKREYVVDDTKIVLISGGKPQTIHADSRYQVPEIIQDTEAIAAVDGAFFNLKYLDSNTMIGPVLSRNNGFVPGNESENPLLDTRPLALISDRWIKFVPFSHESHNTLAGIQQAVPEGNPVTDAFVGAAWLVKGDRPQPAESFGTLFDYDAYRHRAFWGINHAGQPVIGVTKSPIDSVGLGKVLHKLGFRDAIMLDSGASTSLAYEGESLVGYTPRPVPHVVALFPLVESGLTSIEAENLLE